MTNHDPLRDAVSWAVQLKLATEDAASAQQWEPETAPQRIEELQRTRKRLEHARQSAVAAGALAPDAQIHIRRYRDSTAPATP